MCVEEVKNCKQYAYDNMTKCEICADGYDLKPDLAKENSYYC